MAGAPSHLELFDNKPQLAKFDGTLPPPELLKGYRAAFINPNSKLLGPEVQVRQARPVRDRAFRAAAAPGDGRRRHRGRQVDGHRRVQPRPGPDPDEHRLAALRPAELRRLDAATAWAASRRTCPASSSSAPARKGPAAAIPTGAAASCRPSTRACSSAPAATRCCTCRTRAASTPRSSATRSTPFESLNRLRLDEVGDPEIATRINSFEMAFRMQPSAPGGDGHRPRAAAHPRDVRRRAGQAVVRQHLPAGPAAARARRAVRADLPRGVGPARQPGRTTSSTTARRPTRPAPP